MIKLEELIELCKEDVKDYDKLTDELKGVVSMNKLTCPKCHSTDIDKSSGLFDYDYTCDDYGNNFNDKRESSGLFGSEE